jgi:hypothetical protein
LRTRSTNSTRHVTWHYCGAPSTGRRCGATTSASCARVSSMSATSFFDGFKATRIGTSCRHLGRGLSSSTRCFNQGRTKSSTRTGGSSLTHGTLNTCTRFILE